jgi:hypothetical protein
MSTSLTTTPFVWAEPATRAKHRLDLRLVIADNASTDGTLQVADSRVEIVPTALADLRGVARLLWRRRPEALTLVSSPRPTVAP